MSDSHERSRAHLEKHRGIDPQGRMRCPICGMAVPTEQFAIHRMAEKYVLERIRADHPEWVEDSGACPKCLEFYESL